jgi:hypothetical protein
MSRRVHGDIITEYHFLKRKVKKMILKAEQEGPLQQSRVIKKIANLMRKLALIEEDCKSMGLPHPDAYGDAGEPSLSQMQDTVFGGPKIRSVLSPDGRLYGKEHPVKDQPGTLNKVLVKLNPDGTLYEKEALNQLQGVNKLVVKSNPDGLLFETPRLEGSILPRRTEVD